MGAVSQEAIDRFKSLMDQAEKGFPVPFRHGEHIGFSYLVSQKYTGDIAAIKVLHNSETLKFNVKLKSHRRLIPSHNKGRPPSYYIVAGLVFSIVSIPYLRSETTCDLNGCLSFTKMEEFGDGVHSVGNVDGNIVPTLMCQVSFDDN